MKMIDRRTILKTGLGAMAGLIAAPLFGAEAASKLATQKLAGKVSVIAGAPAT